MLRSSGLEDGSTIVFVTNGFYGVDNTAVKPKYAYQQCSGENPVPFSHCKMCSLIFIVTNYFFSFLQKADAVFIIVYLFIETTHSQRVVRNDF